MHIFIIAITGEDLNRIPVFFILTLPQINVNIQINKCGNKQKRGRKKMETKTDYLRVRLTREEKMRLDLNSTRQGMTISDYAKSGLRYQKVFGKQVEDIQTDWELGDLTAEEQEKLDAAISDLRSAYLILNELTEKKKVPAWTKNLIRDYILSILDRE